MLKKFWITFLSFLPFGASAVSPVLIGGIAAVTGVAGFSIYRSMSPTNMADSLKFFSSCWSCQMFSDIMSTMSNILPSVYSALGKTIITFAIAITAIWVAWQLFKSYTDKPENVSGWSLSNTILTHFIKIGIVAAALIVPLPRIMTSVVIEPVFNVGLYANRALAGTETFDACVVATALGDANAEMSSNAPQGMFSPKFRHSLACEVATIHQVTGVGMTVGWTMLNMAFNDKYMHKIMWGIPIFPNVLMICGGILIMLLFFMSLLPIPLYFLEVFIKLSMDFVLLPLTFLGWLFKGWNIFPQGSHNKNLRAIVDDVINATCGITMIGIMISFSIMFLGAIFGRMEGLNLLSQALESGDSTLILDGFMMRNDSLVTIILMGVFLMMFMTSIPALAKSLFNVSISTKYYENLKNDLKTTRENLKKIWKKLEK